MSAEGRVLQVGGDERPCRLAKGVKVLIEEQLVTQQKGDRRDWRREAPQLLRPPQQRADLAKRRWVCGERLLARDVPR